MTTEQLMGHFRGNVQQQQQDAVLAASQLHSQREQWRRTHNPLLYGNSLMQREILQQILWWRCDPIWGAPHSQSRRPLELVGGQGLNLPTPGEGDGGVTLYCGIISPFWKNILKKRADNNRQKESHPNWGVWFSWMPVFTKGLYLNCNLNNQN